MIQYFYVISCGPEHSLLAATITLSESLPPVKTKQRHDGTKWNYDVFHAGGLCALSEAALKVSCVNTKGLSSHAQLYYGRRERAVT